MSEIIYKNKAEREDVIGDLFDVSEKITDKLPTADELCDEKLWPDYLQIQAV